MGRRQSSASLLLLLSACVVGLYGVTADECLCAINIGNTRRSAKNVLGLQEQPLSDMSISPNAWYRFDASTGNKIPDFCVKSYHCGTNIPIWINGAHPSATQVGPVTLKVCAQLRCDGDCCGWSSSVQVKWCKNATTGQEFFAYKLTPPPAPAMSYCAGNMTDCAAICKWDAASSTCNCPSQPPMTKPYLSPPYITAAKTISDPAGNSFVATKFSINCTVGYPRQVVDDGARFDVWFEADGVQFTKFVTTSTDPFVSLDESYLNGHLGTNITCKVFPYWQSKQPDLGVFQVSNGRWFGIKPFTESGDEIITKIHLREGEIFRFKMFPNFPITAPGCFSTSLDIPCHPYNTFKIIARRDGFIDSCAFELIPSSNSSDFITIMPVPSIGTRVKGFTWVISFEKKTENTIFYNYPIENITVIIDDPIPRPQCASTGDPHMLTFPVGEPKISRLYDIYTMGEYYLVKSTTRLFEVQVRHWACRNPGTCNCAVMVREGNNIVGIDMCQPDGKAPTQWDARLMRLLVDKTFPSGTITPIETGWMIKMLSGVEVKVNRGSEFGILDIYVTGLNTDNYTGLCTYNAIVPVQCTTECDRYRVPNEESIFNFSSANLPKCNESYSLPTCDCDTRVGDYYCNATDFHPDQSNLLKTNLTCMGPQLFYAVDEESYLDIEMILTIRVRAKTTVHTNVAITWPTAGNKITEAQATEQCKKVMSTSSAHSVCSNRSDIDTAGLIRGCVQDIQIADDLGMSMSISSQYESSCTYSIESSVVETNNDYNSRIIQQSIIEKLKSIICPRQCSQRGNCVNGTCVCNSGFSGKSCGLVVGQVPKIEKLMTNTCDIKSGHCSLIYVLAVNVSMTETLTCKLNSTIHGIQYDNSPMAGAQGFFCAMPTKPSVDIYYVSLSNDRKVYSAPEKFVVFSSEDSMPVAKVAA